jgi:hypothetical protein
MDNTTALQAFERSLRRRFLDRSTPVHYVSDVRQFQRFCPSRGSKSPAPTWTASSASLDHVAGCLPINVFEFHPAP